MERRMDKGREGKGESRKGRREGRRKWRGKEWRKKRREKRNEAREGERKESKKGKKEHTGIYLWSSVWALTAQGQGRTVSEVGWSSCDLVALRGFWNEWHYTLLNTVTPCSNHHLNLKRDERGYCSIVECDCLTCVKPPSPGHNLLYTNTGAVDTEKAAVQTVAHNCHQLTKLGFLAWIGPIVSGF